MSKTLMEVFLEHAETVLELGNETKVRHVRDAEFWGKPVGTPIVAGFSLDHLRVEGEDRDNPGFLIVQGSNQRRYWVNREDGVTVVLDEQDRPVLSGKDDDKVWTDLNELVAPKRVKVQSRAVKPGIQSRRNRVLSQIGNNWQRVPEDATAGDIDALVKDGKIEVEVREEFDRIDGRDAWSSSMFGGTKRNVKRRRKYVRRTPAQVETVRNKPASAEIINSRGLYDMAADMAARGFTENDPESLAIAEDLIREARRAERAERRREVSIFDSAGIAQAQADRNEARRVRMQRRRDAESDPLSPLNNQKVREAIGKVESLLGAEDPRSADDIRRLLKWVDGMRKSTIKPGNHTRAIERTMGNLPSITHQSSPKMTRAVTALIDLLYSEYQKAEAQSGRAPQQRRARR